MSLVYKQKLIGHGASGRELSTNISITTNQLKDQIAKTPFDFEIPLTAIM
jgi:hypothetical protein